MVFLHEDVEIGSKEYIYIYIYNVQDLRTVFKCNSLDSYLKILSCEFFLMG